MLDVVLPISVLAMLLLFVDQFRRLISHAILNRTIRRAMEKDPASVPFLIAKLEPRGRWPGALAGWIMLLGGIALAVAAVFEDTTERNEALQLAAILLVVGVGALVCAWFVERATPRE